MYPLFVPCLAIGGAIVLAVMLARALATRSLRPAALPRYGAALATVVGLSVVLTPIAFARNAHYWLNILHGTFSFAGLPGYSLPRTALPGWLLQTRDFYGLVDLGHGTGGQLLLGAAIPLGLLALIGLGIWRDRIGLAALAVAAGAALLAYYTVTHNACGYCEQRNLIPIGPLAAAGIGLGLAALAALRWRWSVWAALATALVVALVVGHEGIVLRQRLTHGDFMLERGDRNAVAALPSRSGPVELEGFSEGNQAPSELPLVYNLVEQRAPGLVSLPTLVNDNSGLAYLLGGPVALGPSFKPNYQYVLTRLAGVANQRRTVARFGAIALQRRINALDVTPISGLSVAAATTRSQRHGLGGGVRAAPVPHRGRHPGAAGLGVACLQGDRPGHRSPQPRAGLRAPRRSVAARLPPGDGQRAVARGDRAASVHAPGAASPARIRMTRRSRRAGWHCRA